MAAQYNSSGPISNINITPFVDVVLVVLVALIVTSNEMARRSIAVDLPSAASADEAVPRVLNIVVRRDDVLLVDGSAVDREELGSIVITMKKAHPDLRAVIAADQSVTYRSIVKIIDVVRNHGVHQFALDVVLENEQ